MKYIKDHNKNMILPSVGIDIGESESVAYFVSASGDTLEYFCFIMNDDGFNEFRKKYQLMQALYLRLS
ncbi:MAG: hypothetical protein QXL94_02100 [Candidatus Parvarchaeum sp.]